MPAPQCSDQEFMRIWKAHGGYTPAIQQAVGVASLSGLLRRRRSVEKKHGVSLPATRKVRVSGQKGDAEERAIEPRVNLKLEDGIAIVFSDCHWWVRPRSVANEALLKLLDKLQPSLVVANGDLADFARLCRQPPVGWEKAHAPTVAEELAVMRKRMDEIAAAAPRLATKLRTRGNHDTRMERVLQTQAGDFEGVPGFSLADHIEGWPESWSIHLNHGTDGYTVIKHRYNNGVHATYNNALKSGVSIVTGHLHRLQVTCWGDYRGRRYGVDTGTLADPDGPQFDYGEDNPNPHCSGFAVLTYYNGRLLMPELCHVEGGQAYFRGERV